MFLLPLLYASLTLNGVSHRDDKRKMGARGL